LRRGDVGLIALDTPTRIVNDFTFLQQPIDELALGVN